MKAARSGATKDKTADKPRGDGRRSLLVYLAPDLIIDLKKAALDDDAHVYEIVEEAARAWIKRRKRRLAPD